MPAFRTSESRLNRTVQKTVKMDDDGLYVRIGDKKFRPGTVEGYDHRFDMREGPMKMGMTIGAGEKGLTCAETGYQVDPKVRKINYGKDSVYWHEEGEERTKKLRPHPEDASYNFVGVRKPFIERDEHGLKARVPHYSGEGMIKPGQLDTYRIPKKEEGRFKEGELIETQYSSVLLGKKGSAIELTSQSGEKIKLERENEPPIKKRVLSLAQQQAMSMASGFSR